MLAEALESLQQAAKEPATSAENVATANTVKPQPARDLIVYSGQINRLGYEGLCSELPKKKNDHAVLVLTTPGGDPHAGFRIARALQHHYDSFDALIPWMCKSAGTLICIGAYHLYLDDQSELGPLDIQIKKDDELIGRNSGLDILQAVNYLQSQAMSAFRDYVSELAHGARLSTKIASDISSKLTTGLFSPIFAQIEPTRLAEMQRATEIAFAYGERLNEKTNNLRRNGLQKLVAGYPSHEFVIDRKEARTIFTNVSKPNGLLSQFSQALYSTIKQNAFSETPQVFLIAPSAQDDTPAATSEISDELGDSNAALPDTQQGQGSDTTSEHASEGECSPTA